MAKLDWSEIAPGRLFAYNGPPRLLRRRGLALGQVIGVEADRGIVHVRTYASGSTEDEAPSIYIGHLPILATNLLQSIVQLYQLAAVEEEWWETVNAWRRRSAVGEVGAFGTPLWKAEKLARSLLPPESSGRVIAYAFVKRSANGKFSTIEVSALDD